jgi:selenocysteine lyase/cysteine desulfurase
VGLDRIAAHEAELALYARARLANIPGVRLHGPVECTVPKVGVIPFTVDGLDHGLVAAVLGYEHGVGVRNGCFCAHPYIHYLLGLDRMESGRWLDRARNGEQRGAPGMVRISLGAYNDIADIDRAARALEWLVAGQIGGTYRARSDGSFVPDGYDEPLLFELPGVSD